MLMCVLVSGRPENGSLGVKHGNVLCSTQNSRIWSLRLMKGIQHFRNKVCCGVSRQTISGSCPPATQWQSKSNLLCFFSIKPELKFLSRCWNILFQQRLSFPHMVYCRDRDRDWMWVVKGSCLFACSQPNYQECCDFLRLLMISRKQVSLLIQVSFTWLVS